MQRRFRQAFTSIREHAYVSYAKMAVAGGFCDLELIVVKATSPDDIPLPDKYVHHLLRIFSISPTSFRAFALFFARRLGKTRCWRVALKCLVLLHRLLRSLPDDADELRSELVWARTNRFMTLYPCAFTDRTSTSSPQEYTLFVRSYARLIDEALDCFSVEEINGDDEEEFYYDEIAFNRMKELRRTLQVLPQIQSLIDRAMDCRPAGAADRSFLVRSAMKSIIRESFSCYAVFQREVVGVLENMIQMPYRNCVAAFSIYKKAAAQEEELDEFYEWCKFNSLCGSYEYPLVDRIPQIQIQALENFLNGMWRLSVTDGEEEAVGKHGDKEMGPLIDLGGDDGNSVGWEELLDASISFKDKENQRNGEWQMQVYNPYPLQIGSFPSTPNYAWGF